MLFLVALCFVVSCLVDAIRTPRDEVRHLPKTAWVFLVLFLPLVGSLAWLLAGRPQKAPRGEQRSTSGFPSYDRQRDRQGRAAASNPDDDEEFLRQVRRRAEEQRRRLKEQRKRDEEGGATPPDEKA